MRERRNTARGVTLIELAVVIALISILAVLAGSSFSRQRPRANLANAAAEVHALLHGARQTALATGHEVSVLVFPDYANPNRSTGRFIVYEDAFFDFYTGGATGGVSFAGYDPATPRYGTSGTARSNVIDTVDLPLGVTIGPATGMGISATLAAPLAGVTVNKDCSFCDPSGASRRGAIRFDARGQVTFFNSTATAGVSTPVDVNGGASLSVQAAEVNGHSTLVITAPGGAIRTLVGE